MTPTLTFHGAAECVTGFCARLQIGKTAVLIDCGMFQGSKTLKALNYGPFPFDPERIDAVLLTHAHIDHSGLLPKLMRAGFRGPIYATAGTRDLCEVMLADAGNIQESEVRQLNRRNEQRGRPAVEPIYTERDALKTIPLFRKVKLGDEIDVVPGVKARFWNAGHILGSTSIEVTVEGDDGPMRLLFSGDLGPGGSEFAADPDGPAGVDHLVLESTYGDRERPPIDAMGRRRLLAEALTAAHARGGPLLMPAFAVERSQELLIDLMAVMESGEAPRGEIFLDSPLAIEACEVFLKRGWNPAAGVNPFEALHAGGQVRFLEKPWDSDGLDRLTGWHVILAGSGMCDAGRVRKHLKRLLWRRDATVLLTGFMAAGTLGRLLAEGNERVRIQGEDIQVRAAVKVLDVFSGHADAKGLVAWAKARKPVTGQIMLAHGEPEGLSGLKRRLGAAGFDEARILAPTLDQSFKLRKTGVEAIVGETARLNPGAATALDWHNARAALLGDLNRLLERQPDDAARQRTLTAIQAQIERLSGPDEVARARA